MSSDAQNKLGKRVVDISGIYEDRSAFAPLRRAIRSIDPTKKYGEQAFKIQRRWFSIEDLLTTGKPSPTNFARNEWNPSSLCAAPLGSR